MTHHEIHLPFYQYRTVELTHFELCAIEAIEHAGFFKQHGLGTIQILGRIGMRVGAKGAAFDLSLLQRSFLAGRAIWFYLGKLVWPAELIFTYPRWQVATTWSWSLGLFGCIVALGGLWLASVMDRRKVRREIAARGLERKR